MRGWWAALTVGLGLACAGGTVEPPAPAPVPAPVPPPRAPTPVKDAVVRFPIWQRDTARSIWLHVPEQPGPMPLVVVFHHAAGDGRRIAEWFDGWFDRGVILAFPNGMGAGGEDDPVWDGIGRGDDSRADIAFAAAVVDQVSRAYAVAPDQVFATGFAAGGFLTWQLACGSDVFDGYAPVGNTLPRTLAARCPNDREAHPLLLVAGTEDGTSPWAGRDETLGVLDSIGLFLKKNGCDPESEVVVELPDLDPDDKSRPRRHTWSCERAPVALMEVVGGGHAWPRKNARGVRANRDFETADEIFAFFGIEGRSVWTAPR